MKGKPITGFRGVPILSDAWKQIYLHKSNFLIGITGSVGTGKSWTAVKIGQMWRGRRFHIEESLCYTVEELLNKTMAFIRWNGKPLTLDIIKDIENVDEWLNENVEEIKISPGNVIIFDEAGTGVYVREFFSQDNKTMAKVIQLWRFLRMLIIFVVPEDFKLADSTILRFLDMEITMKGIRDGSARSIIYLHIGWNSYQKKPIRERIGGCRYGGYLNIYPIPVELSDVYEDYAKKHKIRSLIGLGKQYHIRQGEMIGKTRTLQDDIEHVKKHVHDFRDNKGKLSTPLIEAKLGISYQKANTVKKVVQTDVIDFKEPIKF